jgi:hypothetical protein
MTSRSGWVVLQPTACSARLQRIGDREANRMARAWLARAFALMRRETKPVSEFDRRSELAETDPDQFQRELTEWIDRHPEWRAVPRAERIAMWLRATD